MECKGCSAQVEDGLLCQPCRNGFLTMFPNPIGPIPIPQASGAGTTAGLMDSGSGAGLIPQRVALLPNISYKRRADDSNNNGNGNGNFAQFYNMVTTMIVTFGPIFLRSIGFMGATVQVTIDAMLILLGSLARRFR